jgi:quercetin dioxygenase-like cupin family protein
MANATVPLKEPILLSSTETEYIQMGWGTLTWYASSQLGNSDTQTVGKCLIFPGQANAPHFHPNCDEILTVLQGHITHTWKDGAEVEMREGDTITIPSGVLHQARNIGVEDAILIIVFSSADRKTVGKG